MDVATRIIEKFGGAYALADKLGCRPSTVYRWTLPKKRGGTGGHVPQRQHQKLLKLARKHSISLSYADFMPKDEAA